MANPISRWLFRSNGTQRRPSLQTSLTLLILLVLIPTLGIVAMAIWHAGQSYREASIEQLLTTAGIVARSVEHELEIRSNLLEGYAAAATAAAPIDPGVRWPWSGQLDVIRVPAAPTGAQSQTSPDFVHIDNIARMAASSGNLVISNILALDSATLSSSPEIALAFPGRSEGSEEIPVAVLVAKPTELIQTLSHKDTPASSIVLAVTDGTGRVLARSRDAESFTGKPVPDWQTLRALNISRGTFEARTMEGPHVIFAFQNIQGTPGWVAVVGEPLSAFNARWRNPLLVMLAVSIAQIVAALLLVIILARWMLRPIRALADRAKIVAAGVDPVQQIDADVPQSFVSEIETLRQSLESAEAETQRNHRALHDSYEALRRAEKLARIGSWTLELSTGRFITSDTLYELNGADPSGPPLTVNDLQKLLSPESAQRTRAAIARCAETGEPYGLEVDHLRPDGSRFAAHIRGQAIRDEAGTIVALTGTVQDISERHEARERIAILADNLPSGAIYRVEPREYGQFAITYISAGIIRIIGVPATEIVEDTSVFVNAIHPDDRAGYQTAMQHACVEEIPFDHEFRVHTRDGRTIWMHCRSVPRQQADGRIVWDGIARDITGDRLAAEALRQAKETAEAAERSKSDFLATMSHEIRTPMNTVIGMTRLMLKTDLSPRQRNYLDKIDVSAKALLGIINDILDFSKIEAGGLQLENTPFAIESVFESVSAIMAMPASEKGIELVYTIAPDAPRRIHGDPLRLGQVLTNLAGNAIKFTETGDVVIAVKPVAGADGQSLLQFSVRDTGIGLSREQIAGLFRPFTQAGNDTFRKYGGTGLGLAICRKLVELMGGQIWVESIPGRGSTFTFTIALHLASEEIVSKPATPSILQSAQLKGRRVLIVDDNASAREILYEMVHAFGLEVETVESGIQALQLLRADAEAGKPFDLVLLDWRMSGMDGLRTAQEIRTDRNLLRVPAVLMVTAYGWEEVMRGVEQLGLEGVLIKPITESVMFNTILEVLAPMHTESHRDTHKRDTQKSEHKARVDISQTSNQYTQLKGTRVLIVDDNALNREVATDFLLSVGVEVDTAVDGLNALEKLETQPFDAVLMDMHMPRMDGLAAVREIRRLDRLRSLPVIALTAQARIEDLNASFAAGMTAHLTKPIDEIALYQTLANVLDTSQRSVTSDGWNSGLNLATTLERFGGSTARVHKLLAGFKRDFADAPQRVEAYTRQGRFETIAVLAHTIKGSAAYLDLAAFCDTADQLERVARSASTADAISPVTQEFRESLEILIADIDRALTQLPMS